MAKRSVVDRARVIGLARQCKGPRQIMRLTGFSPSFVQTWMHRSDTDDMARTGRPRKITKTVISKVKKIMYGRPRHSLRLVAGVAKKRRIAAISYETVRRAAHAAGLKSYKQAPNLRLTKTQKASSHGSPRLFLSSTAGLRRLPICRQSRTSGRC